MKKKNGLQILMGVVWAHCEVFERGVNSQQSRLPCWARVLRDYARRGRGARSCVLRGW